MGAAATRRGGLPRPTELFARGSQGSCRGRPVQSFQPGEPGGGAPVPGSEALAEPRRISAEPATLISVQVQLQTDPRPTSPRGDRSSNPCLAQPRHIRG
jgi:hypothetical protein